MSIPVMLSCRSQRWFQTGEGSTPAWPASAEIASVQSHAERALQQLAAVREREQLQLSRRAEALQHEFREHLAELEHRYNMQVGPPCPVCPYNPDACQNTEKGLHDAKGPKRIPEGGKIAVKPDSTLQTQACPGGTPDRGEQSTAL